MSKHSPQLTNFVSGLCVRAQQQIMSFSKAFDIGEDLDIKVTTDGKITLVNRNTHKGIRGKAVFLGAVKEVDNTEAKNAEEAEEHPHFMWTWAWKLTDFQVPAIKRATLASWVDAKLPQISIGIKEGGVIIKKSEQEILLRAICMRVFNLQFMCEFNGPTGDYFVLGITKARAYTISPEEHEKLMEIVDVAEKDATGEEMQRLGIQIQNLNVDDPSSCNNGDGLNL